MCFCLSGFSQVKQTWAACFCKLGLQTTCKLGLHVLQKNLFRAVAYLLRKLATFVRTFCKFACVCYLCTLGRHCLVFCKRGFPLMRMILYVMCSLVLFALANSHDCYCNLCRLCSQHCQFSCATFANMFFSVQILTYIVRNFAHFVCTLAAVFVFAKWQT